jgi:uncharacterized membrane protein YcaP (DUF421 family)
METVVRALCTYFFLLVVLRIAGRRTLGEMSAFELVILLIISETTQQAMLDSDPSMTNAGLAIITLITAALVMSLLKQRWPGVQTLAEGRPVVLIENGEVRFEALKEARIGIDEILVAARSKQGLERTSQIKHAVLEAGGGISIIPHAT